MASITLKLNQKDLQKLYSNAKAIEEEILSKDGDVYSYMLTIGNGYVEAAISGMGKTTDGVLTLKSFLGAQTTVSWKPLAEVTKNLKRANHWNLQIWKASGATARATKVVALKGKSQVGIAAGIDGSTNPAAFEHALRTEFGAVSNPGIVKFEGRALFTLLNIVFAANADKITSMINKQIGKAIRKHWGK